MTLAYTTSAMSYRVRHNTGAKDYSRQKKFMTPIRSPSRYPSVTKVSTGYIDKADRRSPPSKSTYHTQILRQMNASRQPMSYVPAISLSVIEQEFALHVPHRRPPTSTKRRDEYRLRSTLRRRGLPHLAIEHLPHAQANSASSFALVDAHMCTELRLAIARRHNVACSDQVFDMIRHEIVDRHLADDKAYCLERLRAVHPQVCDTSV